LRPEISDDLRGRVAVRAQRSCEYCLLHEDHSYWPHQIDHVISLKHGGSSEFENLAYSCLRCNAWKGSDIGSLDGNHFVPLFNPRKDLWQNHFTMRGLVIKPLTAEGRVTARLLRLNADQRLAERRAISRS
jgi:5-methylcytosine-specific restriction endonuclease McrA